jgi:adenylate cyclase
MAVPMERKPAAILAAFVMGDSPVVGTGPVPNAACLKTLRLECVEPLIGEYRGQVVRRMSAGVLAEFANAVDAVQCAVAIQKGMAAREVEVGEAGRIRYRVGVNLCRINVKRDDIFGDEFDDAARLATLAEPGGICIARTVYDEVKSELKLQYEQHSDWMNIALRIHGRAPWILSKFPLSK